MAYKAKNKKSYNFLGGKLNYTGKTKSGKGTVKLLTGRNGESIKKTVTTYNTKRFGGGKRTLITTTIKAVLKK